MNIDKSINQLNKHKLEIILLLSIMLIAFGLYSIPSETYPNINEFDPFYHARVVKELIQTGSIPEWEYMSYWPEGMPMNSLYPHLWHYLLAAAYWVSSLVLTGSLAYNEALFIKAVSWVMPFVGAFGVASMYLLGKEIRNKKAGLMAAILFTVQGNFLYKTMFSEIEEDALGMSLVVFSLFAYIYALKRGGWKNALFAGLAMTALLLTWRGVVYAAFLVATIALWQALKAILNKKWEELEKTTETFGISLIPVAVLGFLLNTMPSDTIYVVGVMGATTTLLVLANYWFNYHKKTSTTKVFNINKKQVYKGLVALLVIGSLIAGAMYGQTILNRSLSGLKTGSRTSRLANTVAEQHTMSFEGIISGLGLLGLFGLISLAYFPLRGLLKWKEIKNYDLLVGIFILTSTIMFLGMNKMHYFFAPVSVLAISVLFADAIQFSKKLGAWPTRIAILGVLVLLFAQASIGFVQIEQAKAGYPVQSGWFKTMDYMRTTPEDSALLTWWDYGHWTAFLGNRHAIVDNTNINNTKVERVANIFTEYRANSTEELEKLLMPELKDFKVTHVGVDRILLHSKWGALTYIADRQCIPTKTLEAYGMSFPQLAEVSQGICGYGYIYSGEIGISRCQKKTITSEFGDEKFVSCNFIQGTEIQFTEEEWEEIKNTPWPGYELTIGTGGDSTLTLRVYGQPDDTIMFFHAGSKLLYDAPINYMYGFRIFFKAPGFQYHELVENEFVPNEEVVVHQVDYLGGEQ